ncbi:MAG: DHH family phosphoesterase [Lachnospiraceae bacterium]|nr:DHH family phosphoesterase [Lachnospiraceae bacterium]
MNKNLRFKGRLRLYMAMPLWFGLFLALIDVALYLVDMKVGIIMSCFTLIYLIVFLLMDRFNKPIMINEMVSFATQYGQIQKSLLRDLELPNALLDHEGRIVWANAAFLQVIGKNKAEYKQIGTYFPEITEEYLPVKADMNEAELEFQLEDRDFRAKLKRVPLDEMVENSDIFESDGPYQGCLIALYLFDNTALKLAIRENDKQSLAVGLLYLDNYEEALDSVEEVRRSLLGALIERKINKYFASMDGIVRKTEKDKFFFVIRKEALQEIQANRFDLLEDVKTVTIGNEMSVTISIGVGVGGLSYAQNYEYARTSMDLALGRGGDQAIVKSNDGMKYYGGKSQRMEKNTRVKARVKAQALKELISTKDRVLIMGHRMTDEDAFGAGVGIFRVAKALGRNVNIVINDISGSIRPMVDHFLESEKDNSIIINNSQAMELAGANTCLVVVDVNKPSITECPELLKVCRTIVVLDHHRQGEETIENATLSYIESYASSACEMVAEITQYIESGVKLTSAEADCLYSGMVIDTNNFTNKAGVRTFEAAAYLRRSGADVTRVRKMLRDDVSDYRAKALVISKAAIYKDIFAIAATQAGEAHNPTIVGAQAANELLGISGIKASFVLTDYNQTIYISARSMDEINVQIIMERLGGGGHLNVAAVQMQGVSLTEAEETLKATLDEMQEEGAI